jgi:predicted acyltransferase
VKQRRLRRLFHLQSSRFWRLLRRNRGALLCAIIVSILLTLTSRVCIAYLLATDEPGDGVVYARLATNLLEHGVFSADEEAPFSPTFIRMPGYPIFIAGAYQVLGEGNNTAVRVVQAVVDTGTCILAAMLAFAWTSGRRRRRAAFWAYVLASICPFIVIYAAAVLTETLTTFLMAAMTLTATLALKSQRRLRSALWWILTGLIAGAAVFVRPDAGLFAAGIGVTLVIRGVFHEKGSRAGSVSRLVGVVWKGAIFSLGFLVVLTPWTVRNWRTFGVFQPLSPAHGEMPGEFVASGYNRWLRTWVDDSRFTEPMLWNLNEKPIKMSSIPEHAFDSPEEKQEVAALLDQYNYPPGTQKPKQADEDSDSSDSSDDSADDNSDSADENSPDQPDDNSASDDDRSDDQTSDDQSDDDDARHPVKMTAEIDEKFDQIADARIARSPLRYYFWNPLKRAGALWFDSHSVYWPFGGQMSKVADLDYDEHQEYWLPLFTLLTWGYTTLAVLGAFAMWRDTSMRRWLVLLVLMTLPRLIFFSTVENPEPRYVVELFLFTAIAGGVWLAGRKRRRVERPDPSSAARLVSLDVFRGITIAAMTLVNEPGTWNAVYPPLLHAEWNGATPADWIFPFFLFIVGVSIAFSFGKYRVEGPGAAVYRKIARRTALLFALGLLLNIFPVYNLWTGLWFDPGHVRILGVLQRIAICYLIAALMFLGTRWRTQVAFAMVLLLGYWVLMTLAPPPGCDTTSTLDVPCNLGGYVDRAVLGLNHMWNQSQVVDPEGVLSTIPAIATTILGLLIGQWLRSVPNKRKVQWMLGAGAALFAIGWLWSFAFPLNKNLWTSSYVLYTGGLATVFLTGLYWLVDLKGYKGWAVPFVIFGTNSIALYAGSSLFAMMLNVVEVDMGDSTQTLQERIFNEWFLPYGEPMNASLMFATAFLLVWLVLIWLMYRKRLFVKI